MRQRVSKSSVIPLFNLVRTKRMATKKTDESDTKSRRFHPGTVALREIKQYQRSSDTLIQRSPFVRLVKEVLQGINPEMHIQSLATVALQEAAEAFLTSLFEDSNLIAIHGKRTTVTDKDLKLVCRIRGEQQQPSSAPPSG